MHEEETTITATIPSYIVSIYVKSEIHINHIRLIIFIALLCISSYSFRLHVISAPYTRNSYIKSFCYQQPYTKLRSFQEFITILNSCYTAFVWWLSESLNIIPYQYNIITVQWMNLFIKLSLMMYKNDNKLIVHIYYTAWKYH